MRLSRDLSPFYRCENRGSEEFGTLPRMECLANGGRPWWKLSHSDFGSQTGRYHVPTRCLSPPRTVRPFPCLNGPPAVTSPRLFPSQHFPGWKLHCLLWYCLLIFCLFPSPALGFQPDSCLFSSTLNSQCLAQFSIQELGMYLLNENFNPVPGLGTWRYGRRVLSPSSGHQDNVSSRGYQPSGFKFLTLLYGCGYICRCLNKCSVHLLWHVDVLTLSEERMLP